VYRFDDLLVLEGAAMPAALVECGVIVNRAEEREAASPARQEAVAGAIAAAVRTALGGDGASSRPAADRSGKMPP
jgi:N-acetylmuramoyl-L-alanine amidase